MTRRSVRQPDRPSPGYSHIVMRDTMAGPTAYVKGSRLAVWHIVGIVWRSRGDPAAYASDYGIPGEAMREALVYAREHRAEIQGAIDENASYTPERARAMPPGSPLFVVPGGLDSMEDKRPH